MSTPSDLLTSTLSLPRLYDDGIPTASIAILSSGTTTTHTLTSGPEDPSTVYQAASISKAITSLAIARLVDQGTLRYDTKAVDHLDPDLVDVIVDERTRHLMQYVDVRMLVSHTSGLSQHGFPGYGSEAEVARPEDIIAGRHPSNTPRMRFVSFPGAQCCYSGGGFVLLQLMLEEIRGKPFPEIMRETVLAPLGMSRSWYGDLPEGETNFTRAHFTAHTRSEMGRGYNILPELAAAGLWTTPTDLLKAVCAIQDSLHSSTSSGFVQQETAKQLLTPILSSGGIGTFGLGWVINDVAFGHGGDNWPGYNTYVAGFRDGGNGVAIMMNSVLGHQECTKQILAAAMWAQGWKGSEGKEENWMPNLRDGFVPYAAPEGSAGVGEGWKAWEGKWEGGYEILERDGGPGLRFEGFPPMKLKAAAAPVREFEGGRREVWCVVDGLKMGVRLTWDEDRKGEEIVKLQLEEAKVLKRVAS